MGRFFRGRKMPVGMVPPSVGGDRGGRRYLPDTRTAVPLPTTFADPTTTIASFRAALAADAPPLDPQQSVQQQPYTHQYQIKHNPAFPYRLYEITLRRSMLGLTNRVKRDLMGLGFVKRHQVVWRRVTPDVAGRILKVKELVDVRLTNDVPDKVPIPPGFKKTESAIGRLL